MNFKQVQKGDTLYLTKGDNKRKDLVEQVKDNGIVWKCKTREGHSLSMASEDAEGSRYTMNGITWSTE